ncbi:unnamed protein product, partial [Prorocentrum cordatum]
MSGRAWTSPNRGRADRGLRPQRQDVDESFEQFDEEAEDYDAVLEPRGTDRDSGGTRDNLPIPIFDGTGWRDFSWRVEAWQLATSLKQERRGPALYARLPDDTRGLELLMLNLKDRFEEQEVLRQGDVIRELFVLLKRRHQEQIRTLHRRFNTLVHRLAKFAVTLPPVVLGRFFLEKPRLPSDRRAIVLASANNAYDIRITSAAVERICPNVAEFDKTGRGQDQPFKPKKFTRTWTPKGGQQRAMHAEMDDQHDPMSEYLHDHDDDEESFLANGGDPTDLPGVDAFEDPEDNDQDDDEADGQEATMAALAKVHVATFRESSKRLQHQDRSRAKFTSAEFKTKDFKNERAEPHRALAAMNSTSSMATRSVPTTATKKKTNTTAGFDSFLVFSFPVFIFASFEEMRKHMWFAIYDSGCTSCVIGYNMLKLWAPMLRRCARGLRCQLVAEEERFRFGAGDPVWSAFAALIPICISHRNSGILRVSIAPGGPLLPFSRPAAKQLGIRDDPRSSSFSFQRSWACHQCRSQKLTPSTRCSTCISFQQKGATQTTMAELREEPLTIGVETPGHETRAALRESLRAVRPPEGAMRRMCTVRSDLASGFSKLRKHEAAAFYRAAGIAIKGAVDALKLGVKAWAAAEEPMPACAVSARSLQVLASGSARPRSGPPPKAAPSGPPPKAVPNTPPVKRELQAKLQKRRPPRTSSRMGLGGNDDRLDGAREMTSRTAATAAAPPSEAAWGPDLENINEDSETETSGASQPTASDSDADEEARAQRALPAMCLAVTIGESAGLDPASGIFKGAESESASKETRLAIDEGGAAKLDFVEIWGGKAAAPREAARRGFRVGQPWGIECGDDLAKLAAREELVEFVEREGSDCAALGPLCRIWSHAQKLVFKGDKQRPRRARLKEVPTLKLVETIFATQYEGGRIAALEHPRLGRSWGEGPWVLATHEALEKHCGLRCPEGHGQVELKGFGRKGISWSQVYTKAFNGRIVGAFEEVLNQTHHAMAADADDDGDEAPEEEPVGARKGWSSALKVRSQLRRLRQNIGHPSGDDLARDLRPNGVGDVLVRVAKHLRCATRNRTKSASSPHRVSRLSPVGGFSDELGVDGPHLRNAHGKPYLFPSIVEASATHRVARHLKNRLDPGGMFYAEFQEAMDMMGIRVKAVAGQSQWQNNSTERRGGWLKLMVSRAVEHKSVKDRGYLETAIWGTCQDKNDM